MTYSFYIVVPYVFFTMNRMVFSFLFLPPRMGKEKRGERKEARWWDAAVELPASLCTFEGVWHHTLFFFFISGGEVWDGREKKKGRVCDWARSCHEQVTAPPAAAASTLARVRETFHSQPSHRVSLAEHILIAHDYISTRSRPSRRRKKKCDGPAFIDVVEQK